ncbi:hypothetical protein [Microbacterium elymi]|uniref:Uncharacterized protein n=1 Tax=Microbacterium elymi TaxID=2909587 RepID=A0ABY5NL69_9MICO|nr:hypothetical protein [Microbacterium elymi]UUT35874.1 hypothetical protein L2X98_22210 [Microbacterium elymi]
MSLSSGPVTRTTLTIAAGPAAGTSTITRAAGSFLADGYLTGLAIGLVGTGADDNVAGCQVTATQPCLPYVITEVTATTLTVQAVLTPGVFTAATVSGILPSPVLTTGFSTAAQTDVRSGDGDDQVSYNINAPVSVDGGTGFNKMVVLGTEFADHIVVTAAAIYGAGIAVSYVNVQVVEVDALQGDDTIDVLSTALGVVTRVLGGLGSDVINVAGDVVGDVVSRDPNGTHSTINELVSSADPAYRNVVAAGTPVSVARPTQGAVIIDETGGVTSVRRLSGDSPIGTLDSYGVRLASAPTSDVWITVSAGLSPDETRPGADTVFLCTGTATACSTPADFFRTVYVDGVPQYEGLNGPGVANRSIVLHFTATDWNIAQTVWLAAANDTTPQGDIVVAIAHSVISADPTFAGAVVRDVLATVRDNLTPGVEIVQQDAAGQPDGHTTVIEGTTVTQLTDTFTLALAHAPTGTVTEIITPTDGRVILSSTDARFSLGAVVGGIQTYLVTFSAADDTPVTITVRAAVDFRRMDPAYTTLQLTTLGTGAGRDATFDAVTGQLDVLVYGDSTPGVYTAPTGGSTVVSVATGGNPGVTDTFTVRLLSAPTARVTVGLVTDGQVLITTDSGCATSVLGRVCLVTINGTPTPAVTFDATNWWIPITVTVSADSGYVLPAGRADLYTFPKAPHLLSAIRGPLLIDGGTGGEQHP